MVCPDKRTSSERVALGIFTGTVACTLQLLNASEPIRNAREILTLAFEVE
jgi:hypothetical protein